MFTLKPRHHEIRSIVMTMHMSLYLTIDMARDGRHRTACQSSADSQLKQNRKKKTGGYNACRNEFYINLHRETEGRKAEGLD